MNQKKNGSVNVVDIDKFSYSKNGYRSFSPNELGNVNDRSTQSEILKLGLYIRNTEMHIEYCSKILSELISSSNGKRDLLLNKLDLYEEIDDFIDEVRIIERRFIFTREKCLFYRDKISKKVQLLDSFLYFIRESEIENFEYPEWPKSLYHLPNKNEDSTK